VKISRCAECGNETYQKDTVCVLCKIDITRMHEELADLLKKDNEWNLRTQEIKVSE
jgi:hypothetical protein